MTATLTLFPVQEESTLIFMHQVYFHFSCVYFRVSHINLTFFLKHKLVYNKNNLTFHECDAHVLSNYFIFKYGLKLSYSEIADLGSQGEHSLTQFFWEIVLNWRTTISLQNYAGETLPRYPSWLWSNLSNDWSQLNRKLPNMK